MDSLRRDMEFPESSLWCFWFCVFGIFSEVKSCKITIFVCLGVMVHTLIPVLGRRQRQMDFCEFEFSLV